MRALVAALAALASVGCADVGPYTCTDQAQCRIEAGGVTFYGFCEYETERCAWWDSACPGGLVLDDSAGESAGTCAPGVCESGVIVTPPTEVACSAETRMCLDACETECDDDECADECWGDCLAGDTDPDGCEECITDATVACANTGGCQAQWDGVECCVDLCDDPGSPVCESACSEAAEDHDDCAAGLDVDCGQAAIDICFPPA